MSALSPQREDGAGGFANDVMRRRPEEPKVERAHSVHAHHNEFHVLGRRHRQDLAIGLPSGHAWISAPPNVSSSTRTTRRSKGPEPRRRQADPRRSKTPPPTTTVKRHARMFQGFGRRPASSYALEHAVLRVTSS